MRPPRFRAARSKRVLISRLELRTCSTLQCVPQGREVGRSDRFHPRCRAGKGLSAEYGGREGWNEVEMVLISRGGFSCAGLVRFGWLVGWLGGDW